MASTEAQTDRSKENVPAMQSTPEIVTPRRGRAFVAALGLTAAVALTALTWAQSASAAFDVVGFGGAVTDPAGAPVTQAGAHPDVTTTIDLATVLDEDGRSVPAGNLKDVVVELPKGLIGDPAAAPKCPGAKLAKRGAADCPVGTEVGFVEVTYAQASGVEPFLMPGLIYNVEPPPGVVARFGFNILGAVVVMDATVTASGGYHVNLKVLNGSQGMAVIKLKTTFWGVPADPSHDNQRGACLYSFGQPCKDPSPVPRKAFLSLPTACTGAPMSFRGSFSSWDAPASFISRSFDRDANGNPFLIEGCDELPFDPSIEVRPTTQAPDAPTGLDVDVSVPQSSDPDGLATAHLKDVEVTLPEGMTVSPSSADGLAACSDSQFGLGDDAPATCPDAAKIGTVEIDTPVLDEPLPGSVYVGEQRSADPESGDLFRLFMLVDSPARGVRVKLGGQVRADARTGRLTARFLDNPQMPVSRISVRLQGGPRAPLATPPTCGTKTVTAAFASWARPSETRVRDDSFAIDCPAAAGFSPDFRAGTTSLTGGAFSPFVARIQRDDREQYLAGVRLDMPEGLLAKLKGVARCPDAVAGDGTPGVCSASSRIGTATVAAGPGSSPFSLSGDVHLTGPYKGGPYGLAVQVHAKAGPYDLGWVKVRQALHVDPVTARVSVVSDPLPQIVKGVPIRLRSVHVDVDRPDFAINPTSCASKSTAAALSSVEGAVHTTASRFQAAECGTLAFTPRLGLRLSGRRQTKTGGHPRLKAVLTQGAGQANTGSAKVTLPKSIALDARNSSDPKLVCDYDAGLRAACPASSIVGRATARTPILDRPLKGDVHLVQGISFGKKGNRIRTLPTLLVTLRGEVAIDLRGKTSVDGSKRLVTTFPAVPDAPVSKFAMTIDGGKRGILVVTRTVARKVDLCAGRQLASIELDGHNGKRADFASRVGTPCGARKAKSRNAKRGSRR